MHDELAARQRAISLRFAGHEVKAEFEEQVWQPLDQYTSEGLRAIDRLAQILTECRRACSGEEAFR